MSLKRMEPGNKAKWQDFGVALGEMYESGYEVRYDMSFIDHAYISFEVKKEGEAVWSNAHKWTNLDTLSKSMRDFLKRREAFKRIGQEEEDDL